MLVSDFVSEVQEVVGSGFSDDDTRILRWTNRLYRILLTRSRWNRQVVSLGPTVADQANYSVPSNVYEILALRVGTVPYDRGGIRQAWDLEDDQIRRLSVRGVFTPDFTSAGVRQLTLFPTPGAPAGDAIDGDCVVYPADLVNADSFNVPEEYVTGLMAGVTAIIKRFGDEMADEAQLHDAQFNQTVESLRRDANKRLSSGPVQMQIKRIHTP